MSPEVIRTIHPNDLMLEEDSEEARNHYFSVGDSAMRSVHAALRAAGRERVERILDLPCGHGRVLRSLRAAYPDAAITACDLDRECVDFCAATFGARPLYSVPDLRALELDERFDLIWTGSLITHLTQAATTTTVDFLIRHLAPEGVLVMTSHGRYAIHIQQHARKYLDDELFGRILEGYTECGYGYASYRHDDSYGISLIRPSWLMSLLEQRQDVTVLGYQERGWDNHHDVFAVVARPINVA